MDFLETTRSQYRCRECNSPFKADTPSNVEVSLYVKFIRNLCCPQCGCNSLTMGMNLREDEDIARRIDGTIPQRAQNWLENGDVGTSSRTIFNHFMQGSSPGHTSVPSDLADLRRCIFLLGHIPEWESRMKEMEAVEGWRLLANNWTLLVELYRREAPNLNQPAPTAHDFLKSLTEIESPKSTPDRNGQ